MNGRMDSFTSGRRTAAVILFILAALYLGLALTFPPEAVSGLRFGPLGTLEPATRGLFLGLALVSLAAGALVSKPKTLPERWLAAWPFLAGAGLFLAALAWGAMGRRLDVIGVFAQSFRLAAPIALGAMAGILCERTGVVNIAIEGLMLTSACVGFLGALLTNNLFWGLVAAVGSGMVMALLHAALSIQYRVDQIISGTVINILAVGVTGFIRRSILMHPDLVAPGVFPTWKIPLLSEIPVLGPVLFRQQPMVYAMLGLTVLLHAALFHTRWGLRTRAVGEHPRAADTLGVPVVGLQYVNVILGGGVAGLGGAWFSLETVGRFDEIMTGGKGFIALAAMIFGKWTPGGALVGALLFGSADALQIKLQIAGVAVPYQFLGMAPYLVTMVVLAGIVGRATPPAAIGQRYDRDG